MIHPDKISGRLGNRMFQIAYLYAQTEKGNIPDIYVQDEKFFRSVKEEIKNLFGTNISYQNYIAIHIRRGDYVNNSFYVNLTETDYYKKAIAQFPGDKFMIFSDDPVWCQKQWKLFDPNWMTVSYGRNEVEDLNFMASCKGIIMANSSFSWWGAYLGFMEKKVICPKAWFTNGKKRVRTPKAWKKI